MMATETFTPNSFVVLTLPQAMYPSAMPKRTEASLQVLHDGHQTPLRFRVVAFA